MKRACKRCLAVKDTSEFPPVSGAPICSQCVTGLAVAPTQTEERPYFEHYQRPSEKPASAKAVHAKWKAAAGRALRRLAREFPERYRELLEEEKAR